MRPPGGQTPAPATQKPKRPRTPADENRSINIALYVGGLVLTAAALAFVAAAQDPVRTAVSLTIAYLIFAGTGLWLASRVAILKPAGVAIFGTSLALLAVAAIPIDDAFINNGYLTWTLVSLTGLIVYGFASIHLDSRILGYLVIPFLYSSIFGSTMVLQAPLVWALTIIMVVSALVQLVIILGRTRISAVLRRPFGQLHWMIVPGVLIAALLQVEQISSRDYLLLFSTAAAYYAVNAVRPVTEEYRPVLALASRLTATVALLSLLVDREVEGPGLLAILAVWSSGLYILLALFPALEGLPEGQRTPIAGLSRGRARRWDLGLSLTLAILIALTVHAGLLLPGEPLSASYYAWLGIASVALLSTLGYTLFGLRRQVSSQHKLVLASALRGTFAAAAFIPVAHHPWLALFWLSIWAAAEISLCSPTPRGIIHRAQTVAALMISGWLVGQLADDPMFGARLALLGFAAGSAGVVVLILLRGAHRRVVSAEPAIYWFFAAAGFASGAAAFGLTGSASPVYAVAAMAIIYTTAVLVLLRTVRIPGLTTAQLHSGIRTLAFTAGAAITAISIAWDSAWALGSSAQAVSVTYALVMVIGFGAAETLTAGALSPARWGAALGEQATPSLRTPELWWGTHLAAHGIWAGLINLAVFAAAPFLDGDAAQLWWLTIPAWAIACWAGLRALERADRQSVPVATRLLPGRIYGVLAITGTLLAMFNTSVSVSTSASSSAGVWWAQLAVAVAAVLMAVLAFRRVSELRESAVVMPVTAAAGVYLVVASVVGLWRGNEAGQPTDLLLAATLAMMTATWAARMLIKSHAMPRPSAPGSAAPDTAAPGSSQSQGPPQQTMVSAGTAAAVVLLLGIWHLTAMPWLPFTLAEPVLMVVTVAIAICCLHLLLHWTLSQAVVIRLSIFAATVLLALITIDLPLAMDRGTSVGPDSIGLAHAVGGLALAGLIFGAELLGARRLSQTPAHRWVPVHLASNALWLATVNLSMVLLDLTADLWWFTAVPWAAASVIFTRGAAQSEDHAAGEGPALPVRDLIAARVYAIAVLILLLGSAASGPQWWVQAVTAAAALMIAAGTLLWGSRVPEAPYAVPLFVVAGSAVLLVSTADEVLGSVAIWSSPSEHTAALGYLVSAGVFLFLGVLALAARGLWTPGASRRQLMLVTGAVAVLTSLSPALTAQHQATAGLAWVVPGMHVVLTLVTLRLRKLRAGGALVGSILLPLSGLFAYSIAVVVDALALAVTLLVIVVGTLAAEAVLYLRRDRQDRGIWQLAHWLTAGAATTLIALTSLGTEAVAPQFTTLAAAAVLLVAGLLRGARLGLYWGAAVIVISILWALRGIMFLFLIALGALIIGAAIWRLVAVQKKQKNTPDAAADQSAPNAQYTATSAVPPTGEPPPGTSHHPPGYASPPNDYHPPQPPDSGASRGGQ